MGSSVMSVTKHSSPATRYVFAMIVARLSVKSASKPEGLKSTNALMTTKISTKLVKYDNTDTFCGVRIFYALAAGVFISI
jgi:hypothetical protein